MELKLQVVKGKIFITGEATTTAKISAEEITKRVLRDVGYPTTHYDIINNIGIQKPRHRTRNK